VQRIEAFEIIPHPLNINGHGINTMFIQDILVVKEFWYSAY